MTETLKIALSLVGIVLGGVMAIVVFMGTDPVQESSWLWINSVVF